MFERCVITKGVKTCANVRVTVYAFERCVITKGVKTQSHLQIGKAGFERCVITKGVKTIGKSIAIPSCLRGV